MPNKCKWCGMDPAALYTWKCGTRMTPKGSLIQSEACAEIARLKARIEKNRGELILLASRSMNRGQNN